MIFLTIDCVSMFAIQRLLHLWDTRENIILRTFKLLLHFSVKTLPLTAPKIFCLTNEEMRANSTKSPDGENTKHTFRKDKNRVHETQTIKSFNVTDEEYNNFIFR